MRPRVGDRAFAIDAAAVAVVSIAICVAADRLALMTALVPATVLARFALWLRLPVSERGGAGVEATWLAACTAVGAFNDWNTVVRHGVYAYDVPVYFPSVTTIPLWMLLFWGMILRLLATLVRWQRLRPPDALCDEVRLGAVTVDHAGLKIAAQLALVLVTRQLVYRYHGDPVLSWLPFAVALVAFAALVRLDAHDRRVLALFAVGGPAIEIAFIQLGHLHRYEHGWLGGVPLWIALWWMLAALIWKDLGGRLHRALSS